MFIEKCRYLLKEMISKCVAKNEDKGTALKWHDRFESLSVIVLSSPQ